MHHISFFRNKWRDGGLSVEPAGWQVSRISTFACASTRSFVRHVGTDKGIWVYQEANQLPTSPCQSNLVSRSLFLQRSRSSSPWLWNSMDANLGSSTTSIHRPHRTLVSCSGQAFSPQTWRTQAMVWSTLYCLAWLQSGTSVLWSCPCHADKQHISGIEVAGRYLVAWGQESDWLECR